jgi:hypothetical protein
MLMNGASLRTTCFMAMSHPIPALTGPTQATFAMLGRAKIGVNGSVYRG